MSEIIGNPIIVGGGAGMELVCNVGSGATVTAKLGSKTITGISADGQCRLKIPEEGQWEVSAVKGALTSVKQTVAVPATVNIDLVSKTLNLNTWAAIKSVSDASMGANYWAVGDTKTITINGTVRSFTFSNLSIDVFIIGFNHNSGKEGSNKIHFLIGKINKTLAALCDNGYNNSGDGFRMNTTQTNRGGWESSHMRTAILGNGNSNTPSSPLASSLMAVLPSDLRTVMKEVTKYTDNVGGGQNNASSVTATTDYLFLLAEFEVYGSRSGANSTEQNYQVQYDYFKAGNSKIAYRHSAMSSAVWWWLRSPNYNNSDIFQNVNTSGSVTTTYAYSCGGLCAGFAA